MTVNVFEILVRVEQKFINMVIKIYWCYTRTKYIFGT